MDALLIEAELLLDWYLPRLGAKLSTSMREAYFALWRDALHPAIEARAHLGAARFPFAQSVVAAGARGRRAGRPARFPGRADGSAAYDLASLLQDARVDVPEMMEIALLSRYTRVRRAGRSRLRCAAFRQDLCDARGPARLQDLWAFSPGSTARRQAAIFPSHAAGMGLPAAFAGASGAGRRLSAWYAVNVPVLKSI